MKKSQTKAINDTTIILPADAAKKLGLSKNAQLDIVTTRGRLEILPNIHSLSRLYIESTSRMQISHAAPASGRPGAGLLYCSQLSEQNTPKQICALILAK
ncbi:MAG: hypothetical protein A2270_00635 [Elusimicrobia bacterium RIFOXYA12_FULL_51_18]|nr:MAG: hypothetical protein A2270_00635 [Elusimicrobia bacterium RIFOXYA12_FULL_51_18]OGS29004.1 MAG: hypothetical protein A2218_08650 [Elusimicrobia bacterium RIFOXYA2_FULL_53_38]